MVITLSLRATSLPLLTALFLGAGGGTGGGEEEGREWGGYRVEVIGGGGGGEEEGYGREGRVCETPEEAGRVIEREIYQGEEGTERIWGLWGGRGRTREEVQGVGYWVGNMFRNM